MTNVSDDRLRRLLGGPDTAWLVERVRRRLEHGRPASGTVTLATASPAQRRAVELLLGRRAGTGASLSVSLDEVDAVLRSSGASPGGLAAAVHVLGGPVRDRAAEAARDEAAWREAYAKLDELADQRPELVGWRTWLDATGLVRRLTSGPTDARPLLDALARLIDRLPSPAIPLGRLAAETCGDAHALDEGRPLSTLALSAARALTGLPYAAEGASDARRAAWQQVGVHLDELSSLALCLGLEGDAGTPAGGALAAAREAGEPCVLTLRQLRRQESPITAGVVHVCENPIVVAAAADELGHACLPLVCVNGHPSVAVRRLLDLLSAGGASFAYHGDFDWGGISIASTIRARFPWRPWRYDTPSYEAACEGIVATRTEPTPTLPATRRVPTPWDPPLSGAMTKRALRVEEELVLADLLADLAR
jgi:uncharacterized protein (TIGR02679 family)